MLATKRPRVLIVEDEDVVRKMLEVRLNREAYVLETAIDGEDGIARIASEDFNVVLTDLMMPRADGLEVLSACKARNPDIAVILMTAFATTETAVEAVRQGAFDYLTKPFKHIDEPAHRIKRALENQRLVIENRDMLKKLEASNHELRRVVVARTRELNQANEDLTSLRRAVHASGVPNEVPQRMLRSIEALCVLAAILEREEDERLRSVGSSVRRETCELSELAADVLDLIETPGAPG
ncbi:MAG: response regulator [Planctomycetota bacterium]|jgi:DNA-binding NtrC family response regulator